MSDPTKRLLFLEKLVQSGSTDPMALYGLAMEYRGLERYEDALSQFKTLRQAHPNYVPQYLLCGQMLAHQGDTANAKEWFLEGIEASKRERNAHAMSELESALLALDV